MAKKPFFLRCWPQIGRYNQNKSFSKQTPVVLGQVEVADYEKNFSKHYFAFLEQKLSLKSPWTLQKRHFYHPCSSRDYYPSKDVFSFDFTFACITFDWDVVLIWFFILRVALCLKIIFHTHNMLLRRLENFLWLFKVQVVPWKHLFGLKLQIFL